MKYLILGAGIIGTTIARELAIRKKGKIIVLEKEPSAGLHASGRNSGVIHSGINQKPHSLKAQLCVEGSRLLRDYCKEHNIPMQECGTIVVANSKKEIARLRTVYDDALASSVPGVRMITPEELKEREPYAKGLEALFSPTGAVVDSKTLVQKLVRDAQSNGVGFIYDAEVKYIQKDSVQTTKKDYKFDFLINCAGLHVDTLAHTANIGRKYAVIPFRGDYVLVQAKVNGMIYRVPDRRFPFLGVHLTKTFDGKFIAGPTATLSFAGREGYQGGRDSKFFSQTANSINFWAWTIRALTIPSQFRQVIHNLHISNSPQAFKRDIHQIYNGIIDMSQAQPYSSGIRQQIVNRFGKAVDDFHIEPLGNQIHILNAVSPGLTASMAFAKHITKEYIK